MSDVPGKEEDTADYRGDSVVLDGEMITWDPKEDCIVAFGTLKTAAIETSNNPMGNQPRPVCKFPACQIREDH